MTLPHVQWLYLFQVGTDSGLALGQEAKWSMMNRVCGCSLQAEHPSCSLLTAADVPARNVYLKWYLPTHREPDVAKR
jgi:hypothetical protein